MSSAVLQRSRRSTAGKRLASLVGQAAEDDDAFWNHAIWSEKGGGFSRGDGRSGGGGDDGDGSDGENSDSGSEESDGEASYRMSDEDPSALVDQFDSDFNESESSSDEEDAEAELRAEERREKRAGKSVLQSSAKGVTSARRELMKRKIGGKGKKRVLGEGWNAGLVLNWFLANDGTGNVTASSSAPAVASSAAVSNSAVASAPSALQLSVVPSVAPAAPSSLAPSSQIDSTKPAPKQQITQQSAQTVPSAPQIPAPTPQPLIPAASQPIIPEAYRPPSPSRKRNLRAGTITKTIETVQQSAISEKLSKQRSNAAKSNLKSNKRHFTQEEMIMEAISQTEPDNSKWLAGRRRRKEESAKEEEKNASAKGSKGNVVERFYSRRGGANSLTFYGVDLPEILTRNHGAEAVRGSGGISLEHHTRKRSRSNSFGSKSSPDNSAEKNVAKCVITGKVARYRDPKSMLGYHDLDAFKELRRRLDAGKIQPASVLSSSTTTGGGSKRKGKRKFPKDRTMMATLPPTKVVKVMVTQDGTPVSPPDSKPEQSLSGAFSTGVNVGDKFPAKKPPLLPEDGSVTVIPVTVLSNGLGGVDSKAVGVKNTDSKTVTIREMDAKVMQSNQAVTNSTVLPSATTNSNKAPIVSNTTSPKASPRKSTSELLPKHATSNNPVHAGTIVTSNDNNLPQVDVKDAIMNDIVPKSAGIPDKPISLDVPNLSHETRVQTPKTINDNNISTAEAGLTRVSPRKPKSTPKMFEFENAHSNIGTSSVSSKVSTITGTADSRKSNGHTNIDKTKPPGLTQNGSDDRSASSLPNSKEIIA